MRRTVNPFLPITIEHLSQAIGNLILEYPVLVFTNPMLGNFSPVKAKNYYSNLFERCKIVGKNLSLQEGKMRAYARYNDLMSLLAMMKASASVAFCQLSTTDLSSVVGMKSYPVPCTTFPLLILYKEEDEK
jgi:hypothetical protein